MILTPYPQAFDAWHRGATDRPYVDVGLRELAAEYDTDGCYRALWAQPADTSS